MVQSSCGHWLVSVDSEPGELVGRESCRGPSDVGHVVIVPPALGGHLGLVRAPESPRVEQLVGQATVYPSPAIRPMRHIGPITNPRRSGRWLRTRSPIM
jgi:hypothetical protein